ncbi:MAG TPA: bifunctional diaminohydroxyphosphoribosylaminopyrimidine deaminase/5-amino-6-(5-phosphoribosylamino)uracil reductase RibD [Longimicrobiaceae bacterium]|nr:bifunctional diaminohydroxyphosphoribosylaminopyrimidine deaminase/5-amino-6-(5-phosphoribosylamino)uracil reductase RibD [Longimicrobiaceae bacterium]
MKPADGNGTDREWMQRALALALRGWGRVAPNPLVGCVLVRDGACVGEGWHTEYGQPHAEVEALSAAGEAARGATAYVTLEPCSHFGKTPPCTSALIEAGVRRVVFAAADPNPKAAGGAEVLRGAGIEVQGGVEADAARDQNFAFFHAHSAAGAERPFVALKLALTLDARVADRDGRSVWITGDEARAEVHRLRAGFDAVAVGIGTAAADDPLLTVRGAVTPRIPAARVVFDRALRLGLDARLVASAAETPLWVVGGTAAPDERRANLEARGVRVLAGDDLPAALGALRNAGIRSVFVEGGAGIASALLTADLVDRLYAFYAPVMLGPAGVGAFAGIDSPPIGDARRWRRLDTQVFGADTLITLARD